MEDSIEVSDWQIDEGTSEVLSRIREKGKAWIVGGWVRDHLLGIINPDIDIATNLKPSQIIEIFPESIIINENFGTVLVRLKEKNYTEINEWEVTTLRSEGNYSDGRRPDNVKFGDNIYEDISRRDFTINAMAVDENGDLIDAYNGQEDLKNNILRCVGKADERLQEDGLRIIRAFIFIGIKKDGLMEFNNELKDAIKNNIGMIKKVSGERIDSELRKIMKNGSGVATLSKMKDFGLLNTILPNILIKLDVKLCDDYRVNMALICKNVKNENQEISEIIKKQLKISNKDEMMIKFLVKNGGVIPSTADAELRIFRAYLSEEQQECFFKYQNGKGIETGYLLSSLNNLNPLRVGNNPLVDGNLLASATGLKPGKKLGKLKEFLHRKQIEQDIGTSNDVLKILNRIDWENSDPEEWKNLQWP